MTGSNLIYPTVDRVIEVTAFKDPEWAKAAIQTLVWLDLGAPHKLPDIEERVTFDMKNYVNEKGCGTVCCIAGSMRLHRMKDTSEHGATQLKEDFGIIDLLDEKDKLVQLFFPQVHDSIPNKKPEEAAYTLRKYLFTGEVEWQ